MRQNQSPPPVNMAVFNERYVPGRDYVIKPYQLPDEVPDHPSQLPTPGKRIKNYECGYCQYSTVDITALAEHCRDHRSHPYKFGETGVHPDLVAVHPKLVEHHKAKVAGLGGLPSDVEEYDEVAAVKANASFTQKTSPVTPVAAKATEVKA